MKHLSRHFLLFVFFSLSFLIQCTSLKVDSKNRKNNETSFPKDWLGKYKGVMQWYQGGQLRATIPMQLEITTTADPTIWTWRSIYDSTKAIPRRIVKDYKVIKTDSLAAHHYLMDEGNNILLDCFLVDDSFYSSFEVAGNSLVTLARKQGNTIFHEIIMTPMKPSRLSETIDGQDTFRVESRKRVVIQKAYLKRIR